MASKYLKHVWSASWLFLLFVFLAEIPSHGFSYAETAPNFSFIQEATTAPEDSTYDYIIIGGGTAGCPLAVSLSEKANILVLERGGSPFTNTTKIRKENWLSTLLDTSSPDSFSQAFISEDGVPNNRPRALGGGSVINAGLYTHAEPLFVKQNGMDEALVEDSYKWVEEKLVFKPSLLQWQSAVRNGLLEAGVLPDNGFTYDHIIGTKVTGTLFDRNGNRHSAAHLLEYADPKRIKVYVHAIVNKIIFTTQGGSRPKAQGVIFYDAKGRKHTAFLSNDWRSEIIVAAGAIGSPQLLMLSGIGPASQLEQLGIQVVLNQPMVGKDMADNPASALVIPSPLPIELAIGNFVGITKFGSYIMTIAGYDILALFGQDNSVPNLGFIAEKINGPISKGYLELRTTNASDSPKVRFNYYQAPEDLRKCMQGMQTLINVVNSKSFSKFRYKNTTTEDLQNMMLKLHQRPNQTVVSLEQFCKDTVSTIWHYHGGCQVGTVVDQDYKVLGVDSLRVIDGSTFNFSPGTNPQGTLMMLGRYMGQRILQNRQ